MITLLASIAGFISSIFPEIIRLIKDKSDKAHEIAILDRQIKNLNQENINSNIDILEISNLYKNSGVKWVDGLNASVRPILAYSFFMLYILVKYVQIVAIVKEHQLTEFLAVIWSIDDQAIFASIISYYFGQRTFAKLKR